MNAVVQTNQAPLGELMILDARTSYCYVHKPSPPRSNDDGSVTPGSYGTHLIMARDSSQIAAIRAAIKAVAVAKWADKADAILKGLAGQDRLCLHDGDISKAGQEGYAGMLFVSTSSKVKPLILGPDRRPLDEASGTPYSGCYVNGKIQIWAQDNKFGKRVNAQLTGIQFLRHGTSFGGGGRVASVDEFGVVAGSEADAAAPAVAGNDLW